MITEEQRMTILEKYAEQARREIEETESQLPEPDANPAETLDRLAEEENRTAAQLRPMYRQPSVNQQRIRKLEGRMDEIAARKAVAQAQKAAQDRSAREPKIAELEAQQNALVAELQALQRNPRPYNRAKRDELDAKIGALDSAIRSLRR